MSDDSKNFRRAKPVFMGLRRKLNGDIQNLIKDNEKKFAKQVEKTLTPFIVQRYNMYRDFTRVRDNLRRISSRIQLLLVSLNC